MSFLHHFKSSPTPKDGLTQLEREAIADLLHYGMYADNHIALGENKLIEDALNGLDWDPAVSFSAFEGRSLVRAREAREHPESKADFLKSIASRLNSQNSRERALKLSAALFSADGNLSAKESSLLQEIRSVLQGK